MPLTHTTTADAAIAAGVDLGRATRGTLVFLPGFLVAPAAYRELLAPVADAGFRVVVPRLYRRGPRVMAGSPTPAVEAARAAEVVRAVAAAGSSCHLGGHSRGGFVATLAAEAVDAATLVLVDPVSGGGPPWAAAAPLRPMPATRPVLVVGTALGGRCAPAGRNHEQFAAAAPHATHVVVADCGHADMLDGFDARLGRHLCAGSTDPVDARTRVRALLTDFLVATRPA